MRCIANASAHKPINPYAVSATDSSWVIQGCDGSTVDPSNNIYEIISLIECHRTNSGNLKREQDPYTLDGLPVPYRGPIPGTPETGNGTMQVTQNHTVDEMPT